MEDRSSQRANLDIPVLLPGKTAAEATVLIQSRLRLTAHQPRTGKQLWSYEAPCSTLSSLTVDGGDIFLPQPARGCVVCGPMRRPAASNCFGKRHRLRCENESPVAHAGRVYAIKSPAILVCGDAASGKVLWQLRLKGAIWATPVLADGHLYVVNYDGLVQVVHSRRKRRWLGPASSIPASSRRPPWPTAGSISAATAGCGRLRTKSVSRGRISCRVEPG